MTRVRERRGGGFDAAGTRRVPDGSRYGGEWASRYIQRLIPRREIDYAMVSHWHGDHCGALNQMSLLHDAASFPEFEIRNIADKVRDVAGAYGSDIAPAGHAVVKVAPGGGTFKVFVLDATDESMRVTYVREWLSRSWKTS